MAELVDIDIILDLDGPWEWPSYTPERIAKISEEVLKLEQKSGYHEEIDAEIAE